MKPLAINIHGLEFTYPGNSLPLFSRLNLKITSGERFGLFGPNGAGKTTLMHLMTGLLSFSEGSIELMGKEIKKGDTSVRKLFGFVPQELSFYHELSPVENLHFLAHGMALTNQRSKKEQMNYWRY